jgi:homoserine O-acetyltransferase
MDRELQVTDANDFLYQFGASRDYDPSHDLGRIKAKVLAINSADDEVNPPSLDVMAQLFPRVPHGQYVLLPVSDVTRGHGTHTVAAAWKQYFAPFVAALEHSK